MTDFQIHSYHLSDGSDVHRVTISQGDQHVSFDGVSLTDAIAFQKAVWDATKKHTINTPKFIDQ